MNPHSIRALTLDLDDTLWPIAPAIARAEEALHAWLCRYAPVTASRFDIALLRAKRDEVGRNQPHIAHDFSAVRRESLRLALLEAGDDDSLAEQAFEVFFAARHELEFYPEVVDALQRIASRYPLLALSNGNADIARTALAPWFRVAICAREFGIGKPDPRIFHEPAGASVAHLPRCFTWATTWSSMCSRRVPPACRPAGFAAATAIRPKRPATASRPSVA
jgi:putative hydrolase of the HAD superfamily